MAVSAVLTLFLPLGQVSFAQDGAGCDQRAGPYPVLLVHGYNERPGDLEQRWARTAATITDANARPVRFDYTDTGRKWVDDPSIAPRLAAVVTCLAGVSKNAGGPGQVGIVAHSMGGLATRAALSRSDPDGTLVASHVAFVVTIATPHEGAFYTNTERKLLQSVLLGLCATRSGLLCWAGVAGLAKTAEPAVEAMGQGSPELAALPPMPSTLPVSVVGNDLTIRRRIFLYTVGTDHVPDPFVPLASALSQQQRPDLGGSSLSVACATDFAFLVADLRWSLYDIPCTHGAVIDQPDTQALIRRHIDRWEDPLANLDLQNVVLPSGACTGVGRVPLTNGTGSAPDGGRVHVKRSHVADINGDGLADALVQVVCDYGGSETGTGIIAITANGAGGLRLLGEPILPASGQGDAGRITDFSWTSPRLTVSEDYAMAYDAHCCYSGHASIEWRWDRNGWASDQPRLATVSCPDIFGTSRGSDRGVFNVIATGTSCADVTTWIRHADGHAPSGPAFEFEGYSCTRHESRTGLAATEYTCARNGSGFTFAAS